MHTTQEQSCNSAFVLPRNCTFSETDWKALAPFWYPITFSPEVTDRPFAAKLVDERLVLFRHSDSSIVAARDLCLHRGVPLSLGWVENDELQCKYHRVGYDKSGQCTRIPAQPDAAIPERLKLTTYTVTERYGLVWVRLVDNGSVHFPYFQEWNDPDYSGSQKSEVCPRRPMATEAYAQSYLIFLRKAIYSGCASQRSSRSCRRSSSRRLSRCESFCVCSNRILWRARKSRSARLSRGATTARVSRCGMLAL